ncbi:MAG TPA: UDP-glucose 4-epimerase GalE [Burkholderiales bacterium]|nr:UDP-glucose 4-epimerase GalE [Burkholderiales bacterium]
MRVLVIGGAGYIGSHMVLSLQEAGHEVVVLDDLSTGHQDAVVGGTFVKGSMADSTLLDQLFDTGHFDGVMHFASFIRVDESVADPQLYYVNNVVNTLTLLNAMVRNKVNNLVFSSTAAIYGEPQELLINENHSKIPVNPYGRSKWMVEQILRDYDLAYGLKSVCLRYFNAAGADPHGRAGERHQPETHLIPLLLEAAAGLRQFINIYGTDYETPDGTCIRDYVHVTDLCSAHLLALDALVKGQDSASYNLGNGSGFSVWEVIEAVKKVTGYPVSVVKVPRRPGDPSHLIADSRYAKEVLGWNPQYCSLESIINHAWSYFRANSLKQHDIVN